MTAPTQKQRILEILQRGESVTVYQLHTIGINGATTRIKELRDDGYNIIDRYEPYTNQFNKQTRRKVYSLAQPQQQAA